MSVQQRVILIEMGLPAGGKLAEQDRAFHQRLVRIKHGFLN